MIGLVVECGFKAILYMSMGIPCVCSPVGVNKEIIVDGINGFLANSEEEWIEKLSCLIRDPELRGRFGEAGRSTVIDKYSLKSNAPKYLDILKRPTEEITREFIWKGKDSEDSEIQRL